MMNWFSSKEKAQGALAKIPENAVPHIAPSVSILTECPSDDREPRQGAEEESGEGAGRAGSPQRD